MNGIMKRHTMTPIRWLTISALFGAAAGGFAQNTTLNPATLRSNALQTMAILPDKAPGADKDSAVLVSLGKELYFEKRLSKNNSQSCNTCHVVDGGRAGVDNEPTSPGAFGKRGDRNSPRVSTRRSISRNSGMAVRLISRNKPTARFSIRWRWRWPARRKCWSG